MMKDMYFEKEEQKERYEKEEGKYQKIEYEGYIQREKKRKRGRE